MRLLSGGNLGEFNIFIELPSGTKLPMPVNFDDTIDKIKMWLLENEGISDNTYELYFKNKMLAVNKTISYYNIKDDDTLTIKLNPKTGGRRNKKKTKRRRATRQRR